MDQSKRVQVSKKVASFSECRLKGDAQRLAEEILAPLNQGTVSTTGTMTIMQFVEKYYLPHVAEQKRASTLKGYTDIWQDHLRFRCGKFRVRDFRTLDGQNMMNDIARQNDLSRTTLKHIKSVLSGIFTYAKQTGVLNGINPMQGVSIPKGREPEDTYAYSLEEITRMLLVVPESVKLVVAAAAFTGLRKSELMGLLWEDYDGTQIRVSRSVWRGVESEPKTRKSKAPVPVIKPLKALLEAHRMAEDTKSSRIFRQNFDYIARAVIAPALLAAGLKWHGWHAFRRGLATNLYRLGVPDKTIQSILRHANLATTMNVYVKSVPVDSTAAMNQLERVCNSMQQGSVGPVQSAPDFRM